MAHDALHGTTATPGAPAARPVCGARLPGSNRMVRVAVEGRSVVSRGGPGRLPAGITARNIGATADAPIELDARSGGLEHVADSKSKVPIRLEVRSCLAMSSRGASG